MSKRTFQSNTLLNYFQSPKSNKVNIQKEQKIEKPKMDEDTSDDDLVTVKKKRARIVALDSDSDSDNIEEQTPKKSKLSLLDNERHSKNEYTGTPKRQRLGDKPSESTSRLKDFCFGSDSPVSTSVKKSSNILNSNLEENKIDQAKWLHEKLPFLQPNKIMDASKRKADHPDYDKGTLYVPKDYLDSLSPAMRQWWILKSQHFDTILFFKVGKFYELYHMDAIIGVECLGFSFMKGDFAHSGFPEVGYGRMANSLVEQGYKVARVEQTETVEQMNERCKSAPRSGKFDKVVKREVCQVSTKGACLPGAQTLDIQHSQGCYMIAICEEDTRSIYKHFGVCFIDITIGKFHLAEFDDDKHCSRLLTLMAQHNPSLILLERGKVTNDTMFIIATHLKDVTKELLAPEKQFPSADSTIETLKRECYFKDTDGNMQWPTIFDTIIEEKTFPKLEYVNCIKSLGACIWYLKKSLIDAYVLQMKKFELYVPIDLEPKRTHLGNEYMILDSITLENLKLLGSEGSLQKTMDYCCTPFGKRLFQVWICRPLCNTESIEKRQAAVQELYENYEILKNARQLMAKLPDIERQMAKIHHFGNAYVSKNHPDSRAVLYEAKSYSKRKIHDLMSTLEAFELFSKIGALFSNCKSRLLRKVSQKPPEGKFVDLSTHLEFFKGAFNHQQARDEGTIIPQKGVDVDYDAALKQLANVQEQLDDYLEEQRRFFKCDVKYFGNDRKRFQIEVPENRCGGVSSDYSLEGARKGSKPCKRYSTARSRQLLIEMQKAEAERDKIVLDLNRRIFEMFASRYEIWEEALLCVTIIDCLCSLAEYARLNNEEICIPTVLPFSDKPVCHMENGRHPCINRDKVNLVANDVHLGKDCQPLMILTGPNMGGKSTYMRQTVLIAIMAQIGSYVPASTCEVSLIDRVFTRMGAQDDIMRGRSTFLVELMEASTILKHANKHSFVLLDELGRGTSTHDGNAIARGYLQELAYIQCRGIFATHYHTLVQQFDHDKNIQLGYMTCLLENEGKENERVIFLYKVAQGLWPKSYGFHVASLAGMPLSIVTNARQYATKMEAKDQNRNILKCINNLNDVMKILEII